MTLRAGTKVKVVGEVTSYSAHGNKVRVVFREPVNGDVLATVYVPEHKLEVIPGPEPAWAIGDVIIGPVGGYVYTYVPARAAHDGKAFWRRLSDGTRCAAEVVSVLWNEGRDVQIIRCKALGIDEEWS